MGALVGFFCCAAGLIGTCCGETESRVVLTLESVERRGGSGSASGVFSTNKSLASASSVDTAEARWEPPSFTCMRASIAALISVISYNTVAE